MLVTHYDPFRQFRGLERKLLSNYPGMETENNISTFTPQVNTREGEFAYHIDVDLPGVDKKDIKVDVKENVLMITGERSFKKEVKEEDYYKVETSFGKFSRSFTLPDHVDIENISANNENGVLEIVIPKVEQKVNVKSVKIK